MMNIKTIIIYGSATLEQKHEIENGRYVAYGRSVYKNEHGEIIMITEWEELSSLGWDDGSPITQKDIVELKGIVGL